ncbi:ATP-binding protein [Anaerovoracaceae bacterium 42-11]|nr:ATP-binding protein [Emergencia sp.]
MQKYFKDLDLLASTMEEMNRAEKFTDVADIIFRFIEDYVHYDMAVIYRIDKSENILEIVSCMGADINNLKKRVKFRVGEGAVGKVALEKKPIYLENALDNSFISVRQFYDEDPIIRSFIGVPLVVRGDVIGIISVSDSQEKAYTSYDVKMLSIIASQGALLLEINNKISVSKTISDTVLENISSGVLLINCSDKRIVTVNNAAERILKRGRNKIVGKPVTDIGINFIDGELYEILQNDMSERNEADGYIYINNEEFKLKISTSFFVDKKEEQQYCICVFRDNTEIERLEKQLVTAEKLAALGRLTAGMTHEIRNPLLPISNASEFLYNKYSDVSEELNILLSVIKNESDRLNKLLSQLSALYKNNIFIKGQCSVKTAVDEVLILLSHKLSKQKIDVDISEVMSTIEVNMNKDNLKQVMINLILNSIDAMDSTEEKKLYIATQKEESVVKMLIRDTGIGIKSEEIGKIFEPFFTTKATGSGIGLSLVFKIMEAVGGRINVSSGEGEGTTVSLEFPALNKEVQK